MKKYSHIFLSLLLSMTILYFGSGVNILRCAHTGTVKVLTAIGAAEMSGMSCGMNSSCMSMERVELSPTIMAQTVVYDFGCAFCNVFKKSYDFIHGFVHACSPSFPLACAQKVLRFFRLMMTSR